MQKKDTISSVGSWAFLSNLHIFVVAAGFILGSVALVGGTHSAWYVTMASAGALFVYHLDRAFRFSAEDAVNAPQRLEWLKKHSSFVRVSAALALVLVIVSALFLGWMWIMGGILLGGIGVLYSAPILRGRRRPKDVAYLKTILIAGCWVGGGAVLPLMLSMTSGVIPEFLGMPRAQNAHDVSLSVILMMAMYRVLYIAPNLLAAELADAPGDSLAGISGVGAIMSRKSLLAFSSLCLVSAIGISFLMVDAGLDPVLMMLDLGGLVGLVMTIILTSVPGPFYIPFLDLWAGFPLFTWLALESGWL